MDNPYISHYGYQKSNVNILDVQKSNYMDILKNNSGYPISFIYIYIYIKIFDILK